MTFGDFYYLLHHLTLQFYLNTKEKSFQLKKYQRLNPAGKNYSSITSYYELFSKKKKKSIETFHFRIEFSNNTEWVHGLSNHKVKLFRIIHTKNM